MQHETISHAGDSAASAGANGDSPGGGDKTAYLTDETGTADAGLVPTFLQEIARTMQATADRERERIAADIADRLRSLVETVRSRASTEAAELRRLAEADIDQIHEWSAGQVDRVRRETEMRVNARREDLDQHLRQQDAIVEREIARATEAVEAYQNELGRFVGRLVSQQEPTEIARLASQLPEPPPVEVIASEARADALAQLSSTQAAAVSASTTETDSGLVGVMDPSGVSLPTEPAVQTSEPGRTEAVASSADASPAVGSAAVASAPLASDAGDVALEPQAVTSTDDVDLRLHLVLAAAVIIAIVLLLVITGQIHAASSSSPAQGI
jgi:hypothetical protein